MRHKIEAVYYVVGGLLGFLAWKTFRFIRKDRTDMPLDPADITAIRDAVKSEIEPLSKRIKAVEDHSFAKVPKVIKKTEGEAREALEKAKLKLGTVTPVPSDKPVGEVLHQEPDANEVVPVNSSVDIVTSGGMQPTPETDLFGTIFGRRRR